MRSGEISSDFIYVFLDPRGRGLDCYITIIIAAYLDAGQNNPAACAVPKGQHPDWKYPTSAVCVSRVSRYSVSSCQIVPGNVVFLEAKFKQITFKVLIDYDFK